MEIGARLGVASLLFLAAGPLAFFGMVWVLLGSAVWWFGGQLLLWALPRDVRESAFSLREGPRHITFASTVGALVYSSLAFPGAVLRGQRGAGEGGDEGEGDGEDNVKDKDRHSDTMLSMDTWMSGLWTRGWTLSPTAYCGLRTVEHIVALAVVYVSGVAWWVRGS